VSGINDTNGTNGVNGVNGVNGANGHHRGTGVMPIAIVGAACRFSGMATNQDGLWQVLSKGMTTWAKSARNRFRLESFWNPHAKHLGSVGDHFRLFHARPKLTTETISSTAPVCIC